MKPLLPALLCACALALAPVAAAAQVPAAHGPQTTGEQPADKTMSDADAAGDDTGGKGTVSDEIIVEGKTEKQVREFLWRAIVPSGVTITKRKKPICIGLDNTPAVLADPLLARIKANLAEFSIEVAEPGCRANTLIVLHSNAHAFVNKLAKTDNAVLFGAQYVPELRRLIKPVRPIYTWHYNPVEAARHFMAAFGAPGGGFLQGALNFFNDEGSRVLSNLPPEESTHTFTVIDIDALDGLTIEQLGDYLTMQMLVEFRPDLGTDVPADSILNLFNRKGSNPAAPPALSASDRVIIDQIYNKITNFTATSFRASVARETVAQLQGGKPEKRARKR